MNQFVPEPAQTRPPVEFQAAFGHWNNTNLQKVGEKVLGELKIDDLSGAVSGADRKNLQFMHSEYGVNTSMEMAGGLDQNSLNLNVLYNPKSGDRSQSVMMQSKWNEEGNVTMVGLKIQKEGEYPIDVRLDVKTGKMIGVKADERDAGLKNALDVALSVSGRESNRGAVSFVEDQRDLMRWQIQWRLG